MSVVRNVADRPEPGRPAGLGPAPDGLTLRSLAQAGSDERAAARRFCLTTTGEFYGTEYRPDWYADLDPLLSAPEQCWFSPENRGAFWSLSAPDGDIVATAGLYRLSWKPNLVAAFADRYPLPEEVTHLVRVYVRRDLRGRGHRPIAVRAC